jgi:hypothetical protein
MEYSLFFNAARRKQTHNGTQVSQLGTDVITLAVYGTVFAVALLAYLS